jgi:hypothetical protein
MIQFIEMSIGKKIMENLTTFKLHFSLFTYLYIFQWRFFCIDAELQTVFFETMNG